MTEPPGAAQKEYEQQADDRGRGKVTAQIVSGQVLAKAPGKVDLAQKAVNDLEAGVGTELLGTENKLERTIDAAAQIASSSSH